MSNFLLLGICFVAGILLRVFGRLPRETPAVLNGLILYLLFPAVSLLQLHEVRIRGGMLAPVLSIWLLFLMSAVIFYFLGKIRSWDPKTIGTLILTAGLANTSFVGFPMLEALYGPESLKIGILLDQLGSFLVISTFGVLVASLSIGTQLPVKKMALRILSFPPLYAGVLAVLLRPFDYPPVVKESLSRLGGTLTPMALISVGYQVRLNWKLISTYSHPLFGGLCFKLFLAPAVISLLLSRCFSLDPDIFQVTVIEAAMAPMITSAILVAEYQLNTELAHLMLGLGIPLSFLTIPLWSYWLGHSY